MGFDPKLPRDLQSLPIRQMESGDTASRTGPTQKNERVTDLKAPEANQPPCTEKTRCRADSIFETSFGELKDLVLKSGHQKPGIAKDTYQRLSLVKDPRLGTESDDSDDSSFQSSIHTYGSLTAASSADSIYTAPDSNGPLQSPYETHDMVGSNFSSETSESFRLLSQLENKTPSPEAKKVFSKMKDFINRGGVPNTPEKMKSFASSFLDQQRSGMLGIDASEEEFRKVLCNVLTGLQQSEETNTGVKGDLSVAIDIILMNLGEKTVRLPESEVQEIMSRGGTKSADSSASSISTMDEPQKIVTKQEKMDEQLEGVQDRFKAVNMYKGAKSMGAIREFILKNGAPQSSSQIQKFHEALRENKEVTNEGLQQCMRNLLAISDEFPELQIILPTAIDQYLHADTPKEREIPPSVHKRARSLISPSDIDELRHAAMEDLSRSLSRSSSSSSL